MASITHKVSLAKDQLLGAAFCTIGGWLPALRPKRVDLVGKTAIVTGANSGVGYGLALQLAEMGATVYIACRNEGRAAQSRAEMLEACPDARITAVSLDTSSFNSVKTFAKDWNHGPIDILAHNAGISLVPQGKEFTEDGFEYMYQVNVLSSFLMTHLLQKQLANDARVVFTSSVGSHFGTLSDSFAVTKIQKQIEPGFHAGAGDTSNGARYGHTKLMQVAFARALQSHFDSQADSKRLAFSFQPGLVKSNLLSDSEAALKDPFLAPVAKMQASFGLDVRQGSATGVHLATSDSPQVVRNKGRFFDRMSPRTHSVDVYPQEKLDRLWARWSVDCDIS